MRPVGLCAPEFGSGSGVEGPHLPVDVVRRPHRDHGARAHHHPDTVDDPRAPAHRAVGRVEGCHAVERAHVEGVTVDDRQRVIRHGVTTGRGAVVREDRALPRHGPGGEVEGPGAARRADIHPGFIRGDVREHRGLGPERRPGGRVEDEHGVVGRHDDPRAHRDRRLRAPGPEIRGAPENDTIAGPHRDNVTVVVLGIQHAVAERHRRGEDIRRVRRIGRPGPQRLAVGARSARVPGSDRAVLPDGIQPVPGDHRRGVGIPVRMRGGGFAK